MPSLTCFNVRFTPNWRMIVLTVLFSLLFVRLGFWQIQRAHEKEKMVVAEHALAKQEPVEWNRGNVPAQYQRIKTQGAYLPDLFLLDNQHYEHRFGFDVISPLLLDDGTVVMIDRGWVPDDGSRQTVPKIKTPAKTMMIQGSVYFPSTNQWVLGAGLEKKEDKTIIIEALDTKLLEQLLQKKVYPFIIRLDKQDAYGFVREWKIVSMPPQRHFAYAVQWFAMALVILILFLVLNLKKKNEETTP